MPQPRISYLARNYLIELATQYQYIRPPRTPNAITRVTMQDFWRKLAHCHYQDTRPTDIQALDPILDAQQRPRIWYAIADQGRAAPDSPELRKWKWGIVIPNATQLALLEVADQYHITPMGYKYNPPNPQTPTQLTRVMALLEAIGQQNLTPIDLPIAKHKYPVRYDPYHPTRYQQHIQF